MNLRQYLATMIFSTVLCWAAWIFVIINIDPFETGVMGFAFFYISLLFALIGTISLLIFGIYRLFGGREMPLFRHVRMSFRTAVVLSLLALVGLYLQSLSVLSLFNTLIFGTICMVIVSFDLSLTNFTKKHLTQH
ncbi:MAG TPA: hypothetical protein PK295_03245 [Candidatus Magasanikbacteria bacterium]|nr:hypothetical protein [Candidatus Magasanikbacteria bacterium]